MLKLGSDLHAPFAKEMLEAFQMFAHDFMLPDQLFGREKLDDYCKRNGWVKKEEVKT